MDAGTPRMGVVGVVVGVGDLQATGSQSLEPGRLIVVAAEN